MADKKKRDDEQKRIAEEKAATQAAASQEKESAQSNSEVSGGNYSTNTSGWGVAQSGYCFYRSNSKKYYSSVANPGNYTYMTISEAQGLGGTPGHSNGSAHT